MSGGELFDGAGAIAVGIDVDAGALEEGEPEVAEGRLLVFEDEVTSVIDTGTAAGDDGGAVGEVVDGIDVAAVAKGDVIVKRTSVGFLGGFEAIDEVGEELGLFLVTELGDFLAGAVVVVAHVVAGDGGAEAGDEAIDGLSVGHDAGGVRLHGGNHEVIHNFDFVEAGDFGGRFFDGVLWLDLGDVEPLFFLCDASLDFANGVKVFVELIGIGFGEPAADAFGVVEDGIEDAAFLLQHGLFLFEGSVVDGEEFVIGDERVVETGDGFSLAIPGEGQAGTVAGVVGVFAAELDGGEAGVLAEDFRGDLVGGDGVVETLAGLGVSVGAGEVEGGAPVGFVGELVVEVLDNGEVVFVAGEGGESGREFVVGAGGFRIGEPGFAGDAPAEAEEDHAFWGSGDGGGGSGETFEAEGFEEGESDEGRAAPEEGAAGDAVIWWCGWHGCRRCYLYNSITMGQRRCFTEW